MLTDAFIPNITALNSVAAITTLRSVGSVSRGYQR